MMDISKAERQKEIVKLLPEVLNSLAATVESGFGFDHAINELVKKSDHELARAFKGLMQDIQSEIQSIMAAGEAASPESSAEQQEAFLASLQGVRRRALLRMARRVDVPDVTTFANVMLQTDQLGVPVAQVLRALSVRMAVLNEIEADFENMRTAWTWAVERRNHDAIDRAIETLHWFCHSRRRYQEADALFRLAREGLAPRPGEEPHPVWAKIAARYPDPGEDHKAQIERSLGIAQERGDRAEIAYCLYALGNAIIWPRLPEECDLAQGIAYYEQSLAHYRDLDDKFYMAEVLGRIGWCYQAMGQQDDGVKFARQSLDLSLEIGDQPARGSFPFVPPGDDV
ncbi:MAG: tetratricopeptide repeat protein [Chloroflexi bacterium]|nr:tetratricopeptide repeat protein [Chloroflexota bacterium]